MEDSKNELKKMDSWPVLLRRLIFSIFNVVVFVSAGIFILSPDRKVFWIGVLLAIYVLIRFIFMRKPDTHVVIDPALDSKDEL